MPTSTSARKHHNAWVVLVALWVAAGAAAAFALWPTSSPALDRTGQGYFVIAKPMRSLDDAPTYDYTPDATPCTTVDADGNPRTPIFDSPPAIISISPDKALVWNYGFCRDPHYIPPDPMLDGIQPVVVELQGIQDSVLRTEAPAALSYLADAGLRRTSVAPPVPETPTLVMLDLTTGTPLWKLFLQGYVGDSWAGFGVTVLPDASGPPRYAGIVLNDATTLVIVDLETGSIVSSMTGERILHDDSTVRDTIRFALIDGQVIVIDAGVPADIDNVVVSYDPAHLGGEPLWSTPVYGAYDLAVVGEYIVVTTTDGEGAILRRTDGAPVPLAVALESDDHRPDIVAYALVDDTIIRLANERDRRTNVFEVVGKNPDGTLLWGESVKVGYVYADSDVLLLGVVTPWSTEPPDPYADPVAVVSLRRIDPVTGADMWSGPIDQTLMRVIDSDEDRIYAIGWSDDVRVAIVLDASTGEILTQQPLGSVESFLFGRDEIYIATDGKLTAYGVTKPDVLWTIDLPEGEGSTLIRVGTHLSIVSPDFATLTIL